MHIRAPARPQLSARSYMVVAALVDIRALVCRPMACMKQNICGYREFGGEPALLAPGFCFIIGPRGCGRTRVGETVTPTYVRRAELVRKGRYARLVGHY